MTRSKLGIRLSVIPLDPRYRDHIDYLREGGAKGGYNLAEGSAENYSYHFKVIQVFQERTKHKAPIEEWTIKDFEGLKRFLRKYKYSPGKIQTILALISSYYNHLYYTESISEKQLTIISKVPKPAPNQRDDKEITEKEWDLFFLGYIPTTQHALRNDLYFKILKWTGRRAREPLYLTWDDIDFEKNFIAFTRVKGGKRKKTQYSVMHPEIREALLQYSQEIFKRLPTKTEYEIIGRKKTFDGRVFYVDYNAFWRILDNGRKKNPELKRLYLHLTRASWATDFYNAVGDTMAIQEMGGWATECYKRYIRNTSKGVQRAANKFFEERFEVEG